MTHNTYDPEQIVDMLDDAINQPVTYDINELLELIGGYRSLMKMAKDIIEQLSEEP
jgi:hypothetical protein